MYPVLGGAIESGQPRDNSITFDFLDLKFIDPNGLTVFCNLLEWLGKRGVRVQFANCNTAKEAVQYMDDCGFFRTYEGKALRIFAATRSTTMPLRKISCVDSHAWLEGMAFPWLAEKLATTERSLDEFRTCIREIFNNIQDHSTEDIGCIHIQFFPTDQRARISVSDFGKGIPNEIRTRYNPTNDGEAISLATTEGVSSKPGGKNRGAGLPYLLDNVVGRNGGWLGIYSDKGQLTSVNEGGNIVKTPRLTAVSYPGTLVSIDLRADAIERVEGREDLTWR